MLINVLFAEYKNTQYTHFTTRNGLSQGIITCILQDARGFLWFGTYDGLNKYDGSTFTTYHFHPNDSTTISDNCIWTIYEDVEKNLWIGTREGLNLYDRNFDRFQRFTTEIPGLTSIRSISGDSLGNVWVTTANNGLLRSHRTKEIFEPFSPNTHYQKRIASTTMRKLFVDSRQNLWIGTWSGALYVYDIARDKLDPVVNNGSRFSNSSITSIVEKADGSLWVGTQGDGLYVIRDRNGRKDTIKHFTATAKKNSPLYSNVILSLVFDDRENLWIGTEDAGLFQFSPDSGMSVEQKTARGDKEGLNHRSIWSLYSDRTGNLWIGTFAGGIYMLPRYNNFFSHFSNQQGDATSLGYNAVSSFFEDKNGRIWVATDGGGLDLFNREQGTFAHFTTENSNLKSDAVLALYEDSDSNFWIGTWRSGLFLFDVVDRDFKQFNRQNSGLASDNIFGMCQDKHKTLWICTYGEGLSYLPYGEKRFRVYSEVNSGLSDNLVNSIIEDFSGNLWIGSNNGLNYLNVDTKTFTNFYHQQKDTTSLSKGFVVSLFEAHDSTLWVGTSQGLNRFDRGSNSFTRFSTDDGLPNNFVKGIIEDRKGMLWISTNKGIAQFDPERNVFKNFDASDGLQDNEFYTRSIYRTKDGEIFVGGINGFNTFFPDRIDRNPYIPPIVITDFHIFNKPVQIGAPDSPIHRHISETSEMKLSHDQSVLSFQFTALNYILPGKNQYAYKLEGFEKEWNYVGAKRTAVYTNLDAGEYNFRVKGSNNDAVWNEKGVAIKLTVLPPFWKTWWAYLTYILLVGATIYFVVRHILLREKLKNALKLEHFELEKMYELDQAKSRFYTNLYHEIRTPITLILSPLQHVLQSKESTQENLNSIALIYRNAKRLLRITNQVMDVQKIEAGNLKLELSRGDIISFIEKTAASFSEFATIRTIDFTIKSEIQHYTTWFDPDKIDKIIYNLLSNAFKFTPDAGKISLSLDVKAGDEITFHEKHTAENKAANYLKIAVRDSGAGIPEVEIDNIFQRFYQVKNNPVSRYQGSGVGMALLYELIKIYEGEISVSSSLGQGSLFTVWLPVDVDFLEQNQLVGEMDLHPIDEFFNQDQAYKKIPTAVNHQNGGEFPTTALLIVEDDPELRAYIADSFRPDFRIFEAVDGQEGLDSALEVVPDIIISDFLMPKMDGFELCEKIKKDERTSHIPVILLTALASDKDRIKGLKHGADVYETKPFNMDVIIAHVNSLLENRKILRERFHADLFLNPDKVQITTIDEKFLKRAMEILEENIADPEFNAESLSKLIGMSRMQLYRKIRALTNQTVHEFIRGVRLKRAEQLLTQKRITVTEVAYSVGFKDLTYFGRCFRQQFGKSPSEHLASKLKI